jgi:hypothetical protein
VGGAGPDDALLVALAGTAGFALVPSWYVTLARLLARPDGEFRLAGSPRRLTADAAR